MNLKNLFKDDTGKSLALFSKKKFIFSNNYLKELKNYYKKNKKEIRICMHQSKKSNLQVMVNLIILREEYEVHYHQYSSEYYLPLYGKLRLVSYNSKNKYRSHSDIDGKKNIIGKIIKGERHIAVPMSKYCIYLEFRAGNFFQHKNIFTKKFIKSSKILSI